MESIEDIPYAYFMIIQKLLFSGLVGWWSEAANTHRIVTVIQGFRAMFARGVKLPPMLKLYPELEDFSVEEELTDLDIFERLRG